jgi:arylsulfatase A-like enzyme
MDWNFLFIVSDDLFSYRRFLRKDRVWGHAPFGIEVPLPGLQKLEARSSVFDRAYCTVPVCGPSRAAVMSGYSPAHTGILANDSDWKHFLKPEHIWTYQIRRQGYFMGTVGKVFHGYRPQPDGVYSALYDTEKFKMEWFPRTEPTEHGGMHGRGWDGDEHRYYDHNVASTVIEFLETYEGKQPFWYEVGFHHPHVPFYAPNRIFESINLDEIIMPEDWKLGWDLLPFTAQFWSGNALGPNPGEWSEEDIDFWRKTVRNYIANVIWMDEQLERVIDALDASGYADKTIITFYSDHGYHLADKGHWHKFTLWEECAAAPMMVSVPGQKARVVDQPVSMMDLGPTCLDYAGAEIRPHHRGMSLREVIEGGEIPDRLIPTFWFGSVAAAIDDFRLILLQDGTAEFYDIVNDPWQTKNLAGKHPKFAEYRARLIEMAAEWGMCLVEEQVAVTPGTPFASHLGERHEIDQTATQFIAMGDVQVRARTPGYVRMWSTSHEEDHEIVLPDHVSEFTFMHASKAAKLRIRGNLKDNVIKLGRLANTVVHLDLGDGDDTNSPGQSYVVAHGGAGNDRLSAGARGGELHGGAGDDYLLGGNRHDLLYGGAGNDTIDGARGNDTIFSGTGTCEIITGPGNNLVTLDGGSNTVQSGNGQNRFVVKRTGQRQLIRGFSDDVLDLSDWAGLRPIKVVDAGNKVEVTAALERITIMGPNAEAVKAAITFEPLS